MDEPGGVRCAAGLVYALAPGANVSVTGTGRLRA